MLLNNNKGHIHFHIAGIVLVLLGIVFVGPYLLRAVRGNALSPVQEDYALGDQGGQGTYNNEDVSNTPDLEAAERMAHYAIDMHSKLLHLKVQLAMAALKTLDPHNRQELLVKLDQSIKSQSSQVGNFLNQYRSSQWTGMSGNDRKAQIEELMLSINEHQRNLSQLIGGIKSK